MTTIYQKALLSSGGMDSFLLAHEPELAGAVHVFVNAGQKYAGKEYLAARYVADQAKAPFVKMEATNLQAYEHESGIIPFRNAELILCAAQHADSIYLGVVADEINSDKSEEFCHAMEAVLNISHRRQYWTEGRSFTIETPFRHTSKTDLVRRYLERGKPLQSLLRSVSCYDGGAHHCGRCSSCFKRWVALTVALQRDAWEVQHWECHPAGVHDRKVWEAKAAPYSHQRREDIFRALDIAGV